MEILEYLRKAIDLERFFLTLLIWTLLPAPDFGNVFWRIGTEMLVLPTVAPISLLYGLSSLFYQLSRKIMWGDFVGGGLNYSFYFEMFSVGLGYLIVAYIIASKLEEPLTEYFNN